MYFFFNFTLFQPNFNLHAVNMYWIISQNFGFYSVLTISVTHVNKISVRFWFHSPRKRKFRLQSIPLFLSKLNSPFRNRDNDGNWNSPWPRLTPFHRTTAEIFPRNRRNGVGRKYVLLRGIKTFPRGMNFRRQAHGKERWWNSNIFVCQQRYLLLRLGYRGNGARSGERSSRGGY